MKWLAKILLVIPIVFAILDGVTTSYLFLRQPGTEDTSALFPVLYPTFGDYWAIANTGLELAEVSVTFLCVYGLLRWAQALTSEDAREIPEWAQAVIDYLPAASPNWLTYLIAPAVFSNTARIASLPPPLLIPFP